MTPTKIKGANMTFTPPRYPMPNEPKVQSLEVRQHGERTKFYSSAWMPTADELEVLNGGGHVVLTVMGSAHPPVGLSVEEA